MLAKSPYDSSMLSKLDGEVSLAEANDMTLQRTLERCDQESLPAYLETQKPDNLPWYGQFHFDVVEKLEVPPSPPVWSMRRPPKTG